MVEKRVLLNMRYLPSFYLENNFVTGLPTLEQYSKISEIIKCKTSLLRLKIISATNRPTTSKNKHGLHHTDLMLLYPYSFGSKL